MMPALIILSRKRCKCGSYKRYKSSGRCVPCTVADSRVSRANIIDLKDKEAILMQRVKYEDGIS